MKRRRWLDGSGLLGREGIYRARWSLHGHGNLDRPASHMLLAGWVQLISFLDRTILPPFLIACTVPFYLLFAFSSSAVAGFFCEFVHCSLANRTVCIIHAWSKKKKKKSDRGNYAGMETSRNPSSVGEGKDEESGSGQGLGGGRWARCHARMSRRWRCRRAGGAAHVGSALSWRATDFRMNQPIKIVI